MTQEELNKKIDKYLSTRIDKRLIDLCLNIQDLDLTMSIRTNIADAIKYGAKCAYSDMLGEGANKLSIFK